MWSRSGGGVRAFPARTAHVSRVVRTVSWSRSLQGRASAATCPADGELRPLLTVAADELYLTGAVYIPIANNDRLFDLRGIRTGLYPGLL